MSPACAGQHTEEWWTDRKKRQIEIYHRSDLFGNAPACLCTQHNNRIANFKICTITYNGKARQVDKSRNWLHNAASGSYWRLSDDFMNHFSTFTFQESPDQTNVIHQFLKIAWLGNENSKTDANTHPFPFRFLKLVPILKWLHKQ